MDFMNMLERDRLASKKKSDCSPFSRSCQALGSPRHHRPVGLRAVARRSWARSARGQAFGDALNVARLIWDSLNSAGIVIDAIPLREAALDRGVMAR
jgi:myo-inositol-1-phosphate synthase